MPREDRRERFGLHEPVGDTARRAVVVRVDVRARAAVRHGEPAAGGEQRGKARHEPLRVGKMRKGVIDDDRVKALAERRGLRVAADEAHVLLREFFARDADHLGGDVHGGDALDVPAQIVANEHARAAGNVQHAAARRHLRIIENAADLLVAADHTGVPFSGALIEERDHILLLDHPCVPTKNVAVSIFW